MIAAWFEVDGYTLLDPVFLWLLPVVLAVAVLRRLRRRAALPAAATAMLAGLPRSLRSRFVHAPLYLVTLSALVLVVALARPVRREVMPLTQQGVDIVLVVDISSSMEIDDMGGEPVLRRVDSARLRALEFAAARKNDRIAFVAFARHAELRCPPTLDEDALAGFLAAIEVVPPSSELDGTAIGAALTKAVQVLDASEAESKVVVLLSDGRETITEIPSPDAAKLAADHGVKVHTIGLGHGQPTFGGFLPLDFSDLKLISKETGGQFFQARTDDDLQLVYERIDELEKVELDDPRYRTVDSFEWPLGAGLLLLVTGLLLEVLWIRGVP